MPYIKFKNEGIPHDIERNIIPLLVKRGEYGELSKEEYNTIKYKIHQLRVKLNLTKEKLLSMRKVYIRDALIKRSNLIYNCDSKIFEMYRAGDSVVKISKKLNFSPMMIFRSLLRNKGLSKKQITKVMTEPDIYLNDNDLNEFNDALKHDIISDPDNTMAVKFADDYEKKIEELLVKHGISFKTQKDLIDDQTRLFGRTIASPDFYIPQGVNINGNLLYWIDAKCYYGGNAGYIKRSLKDQSERYNKHFGVGGFVFKHGFSEALRPFEKKGAYLFEYF